MTRMLKLARREIQRLRSNVVYLLSMVVFPLFVVFFFTSFMDEGQPQNMPIGVVDLDNTSTSRALIRSLDAFQSTKVIARYHDFNSAREDMQRNKIFGFLYIPNGTTNELLASRQPKISIYYSYASITAGSLVFKDLKTIASLGSASVGSATLSARGLTSDQIKTFLQPIAVELHPIANPWINYNFYLSTALAPGCLFLFIFLITAYALGTELKMNTARELMSMSGNNIFTAIAGKFLPHLIIHLCVIFIYLFYVFGILGFPHQGSWLSMIVLGFLGVIASMGFGIFIFGVYPSLRMSMSVCSLLAVLSFSLVGTAFPVFSMDAALDVLSNIFPLRHFFLIYQVSVLNGFPLAEVWVNIVALLIFALLPLTVVLRLNKALSTYVYIP